MRCQEPEGQLRVDSKAGSHRSEVLGCYQDPGHTGQRHRVITPRRNGQNVLGEPTKPAPGMGGKA